MDVPTAIPLDAVHFLLPNTVEFSSVGIYRIAYRVARTRKKREIQIPKSAIEDLVMSAEPGRRKAYAVDIRWRVIYQRLVHELSFEQIARNLNISSSTAHRYFVRFEVSGNVEPSGRGMSALKKLDEYIELYILGLIMQRPELYLGEICQELQRIHGVTASPSTICRMLRAYGFTRKRLRFIATQRCDLLRGQFLAHCFVFSTDMFVWVDESGSDARNHVRRFGYSIRGTTPVSRHFFTRGKRVNAIAAISTSGLVALNLTCSTVNASVFFDFVRGYLIPQMKPFDGSNSASIAIMDNLSVHHVSEISDLFKQAGFYSCFFHPTALT